MKDSDSLIEFINETSPEKLKVEKELGWGYVQLNTDEAQRRQAKADIRSVEDALIEMLRNSRDANASTIHIASWRNASDRNIVIFDDGDGIPQQLHEKIFEPRVTSKLNKVVFDKNGIHGRGMALYSISSHCKTSRVLYSTSDAGTAIKITADTSELTEKANQSSWPVFSKKGIKEGPINIIRSCVEFYLQNQKLEIFLGTPSQILVSLASRLKLDIDKKEPEKVFEKSKKFGLDISYRNCQRIAYGQIQKIPSIREQIDRRSIRKNKNKSDIGHIVVPSDELEEILSAIKSIANEKMKSYFMQVDEYASISRVGNSLKINLPLENNE